MSRPEHSTIRHVLAGGFGVYAKGCPGCEWTPPAPQGVRLVSPYGEPIPCLVFYQGEEPGPHGPIAVWEVMTEHIPEGFGQEPGWTVKIAVMPAHSAVRLCLAQDHPMFIAPDFEEEG